MPSPWSDRLRRAGTAMIASYLGWEVMTLRRAQVTARSALATPPPPPRQRWAESAPVLHLLVPALAEQPYVQRTVRAFSAVHDAYPHAHVWFVTTAREQPPENGQTTKELLDKVLAEVDSDRMGVLHDPRLASGNKASQLNWAVDQLDHRDDCRPGQAWIGVFDFDSQPHPDTATWVADRAMRQGSEVIQVVPVATATLAGPPPSTMSRGLIFTEALHHAARSLGIERWKLDQAMRGRRMPQYVVGAGLFVRRDALRTTGGFPFVDDVPLGYRLFLDGARFATVPVLNSVDLPDTVTAHLSSLRFIARGVASWPSALAHSTVTETGGFDRLRLAALGLADTTEITVYPWLAAAMTPTLARRGWLSRLLALAWWTFPLAQTVVMRGVLAEQLDLGAWRVPGPLMVATSLGRRFWRTLGSWRLCVAVVSAGLRGTPVAFTKAPRTIGAVPAPGGV